MDIRLPSLWRNYSVRALDLYCRPFIIAGSTVMCLRGRGPISALILFDMSFRIPDKQENRPIYVHEQSQPDHLPAAMKRVA